MLKCKETYSNPDDLTITTLENAVFLGMKNDVSFLIDSALNLYEHQSTYSPNMPLCGLFYFSDILRNYIEEKQLDLYSSRKLPLPLPQFIVFYNGTQAQPDRKLLYLSDKNRREVIDMLLTSFDEEKYKALVKKEAYEDGWEEGHKNGWEEGLRLTKTVLKLAAQGLSTGEIAAQTSASLEQIHRILDEEPDSE